MSRRANPLNLSRMNDDLQRLRRYRTRSDADLSIGGVLGTTFRQLQRQTSAAGSLEAAWGSVVPPTLAMRTRIASMSRGVLTIQTSDAAARYQLDRFLRAGGEAELLRRSPVPIRRIRLA